MPPTDRREDAPEGDVLSALPRTRPQRRSARRATPPKPEPAEVAAASDAVAKAAVATGAASRKAPAKPRPGRAKPPGAAAKGRTAAGNPRTAPAKPRTAPPQPPAPDVPAAGYATGAGAGAGAEDAGRPGTGELVTTALQAVGEIAQLGAAVGQQVVRSALRRIPRP